MSSQLYIGMFTQIQPTNYERKRVRRKWAMEKTCKAIAYAAVILGAASVKADPIVSMGAASFVCLIIECFR